MGSTGYKITGTPGRRCVAYHCGECLATLAAPLDDAGQQSPCPACGVPVEVPGSVELGLEWQGLPLPAAPGRFRCPDCQGFRIAGLFSPGWPCRPCVERYRARTADEYLREIRGPLSSPSRSRAAVERVTAAYAGRIPTRDVRRLAYGQAVASVLAVTSPPAANAMDALGWTREYLGLAPADVADLDVGVHRRWLVRCLESGVLPVHAGSVPAPTQRGEVAHLCLAGVEYHQQRVVARGYVGRSSGVSIRIMKGLTYRVGAHRGHAVSRSALVRLGTGQLAFTNRRLIFSGGPVGFSLPWLKLLNVTAYRDGFSLMKDSTAQNNKPFVFVCPDPELANLAVSACINAV